MFNQNFNPSESFDFDREQPNDLRQDKLGKEEELKAQQQEERRLLHLYIEMVKETGFCDYFPLEQYLICVKAINEAPSGTLLSSDDIKAEIDKIHQATKNIIISNKYIEELIYSLTVDLDVSLQDIDISELGDNLNTLGKTLQYVFGICAKYHLISNDFSTFSYQSDYSTENQTEIERLVWDLNYYLQYFNECIQLNKMSLELPLVDNNNLYFQRLLNYLWILPKTAQKLAELMIEDLEGIDIKDKSAPVSSR